MAALLTIMHVSGSIFVDNMCPVDNICPVLCLITMGLWVARNKAFLGDRGLTVSQHCLTYSLFWSFECKLLGEMDFSIYGNKIHLQISRQNTIY